MADLSAPTQVVVETSDGIRLHAEIHGDNSSAITVVMCHGFTLDSTCWHNQLSMLTHYARVVTWDHRGHGRSEEGPRAHLTIEQQGHDLHRVIEQTTPTGPVVLVGHSMGGMSILALAQQYPELFDLRIRATALLATTASPPDIRLGLPEFMVPAMKGLAVRFAAECMKDRTTLGVRLPRELVRLFARIVRASGVTLTMVERLANLFSASPVTIGRLLPAILRFDKRAALAVLQRAHTVVITAADDVIVPPTHSYQIADLLPSARLVTLPAGGHMLMLDRSQEVNQHLRALLTKTVREKIVTPGGFYERSVFCGDGPFLDRNGRKNCLPHRGRDTIRQEVRRSATGGAA